MPTCLRCAKELEQSDIETEKWEDVSKKTYYCCQNCGATWLYSKGFNCPVLIDEASIIVDG